MMRARAPAVPPQPPGAPAQQVVPSSVPGSPLLTWRSPRPTAVGSRSSAAPGAGGGAEGLWRSTAPGLAGHTGQVPATAPSSPPQTYRTTWQPSHAAAGVPPSAVARGPATVPSSPVLGTRVLRGVSPVRQSGLQHSHGHGQELKSWEQERRAAPASVQVTLTQLANEERARRMVAAADRHLEFGEEDRDVSDTEEGREALGESKICVSVIPPVAPEESAILRPTELDFSAASALSHVASLASVVSPPRLSLSESAFPSHESEDRSPSPRFGSDSPPALPGPAGTGGPPPPPDWASRCEEVENERDVYRTRWVAERERALAERMTMERALRYKERKIQELEQQLAARGEACCADGAR